MGSELITSVYIFLGKKAEASQNYYSVYLKEQRIRNYLQRRLRLTIVMRMTTLLKSCCSISICILITTMGMSSVNAADMNATAVFIEGFLVPHNQARNAVGVGRLQWDRKLANYARNYARQRRGDCLLQHSDSPFGENIFWGSGNSWTPLQAVAAWIDEKKWFDYAKNI